MNPMTFILTIAMIWVVLFLIALPIGIKMPDKVQMGNADSAPEVHYMIPKIFITFGLSIVISAIYWYYVYAQ